VKVSSEVERICAEHRTPNTGTLERGVAPIMAIRHMIVRDSREFTLDTASGFLSR
jgi:hypothetical protein